MQGSEKQRTLETRIRWCLCREDADNLIAYLDSKEASRLPLDRLYGSVSRSGIPWACEVMVERGYRGQIWNTYTISPAIAPRLLRAGAPLEDLDEEGSSGLIRVVRSIQPQNRNIYSDASLYEKVLSVQYFVKLGANVNANNVFNHPPLHWALRNGVPAIICLLLYNGAIPATGEIGPPSKELVGWGGNGLNLYGVLGDRAWQHFCRELHRPLVWVLWVSRRLGTPISRDVAKNYLLPYLEQAALKLLPSSTRAYEDWSYLNGNRLEFT